MPEHIDIDVSELDFGKSIKVRDIEVENYAILDAPQASIAVVEVPRALRGKSLDDEEGEEVAADEVEVVGQEAAEE